MVSKKQNKKVEFFSNPWTSIRIASDTKDWLRQITSKGRSFDETVWFLFEFATKNGKVDKKQYKDYLRSLKMLIKELDDESKN